MFYINSIHDGGAERVIIELAYYFSKIGYRSILVTSFVDEEWEYPVPASVERISIERRERHRSFLWRNISRIWALRQLCREKAPVALISFMGEPNCRALVATMGLSIKTVLTVCADPELEYGSLLRRLFARYFFPKADGGVFQTEAAMHWFPERMRRKSVVILNPIQEVFFQTSRASNPRDIVAVGRLDKIKNFPLLLKAFSKIADKYPKENLRIYGKGAMYESLQACIAMLHLEGRAFLMGQTNNVPEVMARAKLFVLSSDSEGLPNALMEAMSVGVPVIATDCPCGGPRVLIENGVNGRLVPVGDVSRLAETMDALLGDEEAAERMGYVARSQAWKRFRLAIVMKKWQKYIESLLNENEYTLEA